MVDSAEDSFVMCRLAREGDRATPGSTRLPCNKCGRDVWVAVSSWAWIYEGIPVVCQECAMKVLQAQKANEPVTFVVSQETLELVRLHADQRN